MKKEHFQGSIPDLFQVHPYSFDGCPWVGRPDIFACGRTSPGIILVRSAGVLLQAGLCSQYRYDNGEDTAAHSNGRPLAHSMTHMKTDFLHVLILGC